MIPETEGSWALPLLHERITSFENPIEKAAAQLRLVSQNLPTRPLSLWDAEYGCASFVKQTADIRVTMNPNILTKPSSTQVSMSHNNARV